MVMCFEPSWVVYSARVDPGLNLSSVMAGVKALDCYCWLLIDYQMNISEHVMEWQFF